jgi:hypothetical protein
MPLININIALRELAWPHKSSGYHEMSALSMTIGVDGVLIMLP